MYTPSKAVLEFRFAGEKGLGAGVTASFYSAVAAELQRRSVNIKVRPCAFYFYFYFYAPAIIYRYVEVLYDTCLPWFGRVNVGVGDSSSRA